MDNKRETICRIREFNRFYIALLGILNRNYLNSSYSLTEARVLFELNDNDGCNANYLTDKLSLDKSYLSRIIKKFGAEGLLSRQTCQTDARAFNIRLTEKGKKITEKLIEESNIQIGSLLTTLTLDECHNICQAMDLITEFLSKKEEK